MFILVGLIGTGWTYFLRSSVRGIESFGVLVLIMRILSKFLMRTDAKENDENKINE